MEPIHSIKKEPEHSLPQLYNIKNKRDRRLEPPNLEDLNPHISSTPPQTDETITPTTPPQTEETITPIPKFQAETDEILAEIKKIVAQAKQSLKLGQRTILFVDEVHRFNKSRTHSPSQPLLAHE